MKTLIRPLKNSLVALSCLATAVSIAGVAFQPVTAQAEGCAVPAPDDVKAPPASAQKTKSGLASRVLKPGTGKQHPAAIDQVTVRYTGWQTDGKCFDTSGTNTATFPLNGVIAGWTEGVQLMVAGETRRFWIPENLAYQGTPGAPAGMLVFDVELVSIKEGVKPPATPPDVSGIPADAKKTASGVGYRVLRKGTGTKHPTAASHVTVHYSLWQTDGKFVESSITRGEPITFGLGQVIKGWQEAVQLMVEGEKTRFWIPEDLAYKGRAGAPAGMLVFEIDLLKIVD